MAELGKEQMQFLMLYTALKMIADGNELKTKEEIVAYAKQAIMICGVDNKEPECSKQ
jgi:hypothetical protein